MKKLYLILAWNIAEAKVDGPYESEEIAVNHISEVSEKFAYAAIVPVDVCGIWNLALKEQVD